ncbi:MAG TPA: PH domain-containing protein, partial [Kiloniellaceae bacterium]|nr:PH domain-containing protein [Kiloniellaceae bacterium]
MSHDDFAFEPVPGLPERLPPGETMLWQGRPCWRGLALRVFHLRKVAVYFAILLAWQGTVALYDGGSVADAMMAMLTVLPIALAGLGILAGLAMLYARSTIYSITSRRVVMRFGIALPMTVNLPFSKVEAAALRRGGDGSGDIPLALKGPDKIAHLALWPFARPGHYRWPQPMLRALSAPEAVAGILAGALKAERDGGVVHAVAAG